MSAPSFQTQPELIAQRLPVRGLPGRGLLVRGNALAAILLFSATLVACGPSAQQRREQQAREQRQEQARAQLERCRRNQATVSRLSQAIMQSGKQLSELGSQLYTPSPRPEPPDPVLALRFTQEDRELDELRYQDRLRRWETSEQQRYSRWLTDQQSQSENLRNQLEVDATKLRQIAPELLASSGTAPLKADAVTRATRCSPGDFGLQDAD